MSTPDATPAPAPATNAPRKAGRPQKWRAPTDGSDIPDVVKNAITSRASQQKYYEAHRDAILERVRRNYHARMARYRAGAEMVASTVASI